MKKLIVTLCLLLLPVMASAAYIGTFNFKMDNYSDTWKWRVDQVGDAYQVTGNCPVENSAMNGGGSIVNGHLLLTVTECSQVPDAYFCMHGIDINLSTMKGTDDFKWYNDLGICYIHQANSPISYVAKEGSVEGQNASSSAK
ncbi:MAG: hypothetical protein ABIF11_01480 [Nitrospirota bacterium]